MRRADSAEVADRRAEILVIARHEDGAAAAAEEPDRMAFLLRDPRVAAGIDGEEPQLVVVRRADRCEHRIASVRARLAVAGRHRGER